MVGFCPARSDAGHMAGSPQTSPQDSQGATAWEYSSMQISMLLEEVILYFQILHSFSTVLTYSI